jgi:NADH-quinone oxidoreductase subunit M
MARRLPILSFFFLVFTFSSIGLPGLNGFPGELLILAGMFQRAFSGATDPQFRWIALVSLSGVVLGAWYMLYLVQRVFFGPLHEPHAHEGEVHHVHDLNLREIAALVPLCVFMVWIGLQPGYFLEKTQPTLATIVDSTQEPLAEWQHKWEKGSGREPVADRSQPALLDKPVVAHEPAVAHEPTVAHPQPEDSPALADTRN